MWGAWVETGADSILDLPIRINISISVGIEVDHLNQKERHTGHMHYLKTVKTEVRAGPSIPIIGLMTDCDGPGF
jgi:hypothetical protein